MAPGDRLLAVLDGGCLLDADGRFLIEGASSDSRPAAPLAQVQTTSLPTSARPRAAAVGGFASFRPQRPPTKFSRCLPRLTRLSCCARPSGWWHWLWIGYDRCGRCGSSQGFPRVGSAVIKMHHAMADGVAGLATLKALFDATPDGHVEPSRPWIQLPLPPAVISSLTTSRTTHQLSWATCPRSCYSR